MKQYNTVLVTTDTKDSDGCTRLQYTVDPLDTSHNGQLFKCQATNGIGSPASSDITLNVECKLDAGVLVQGRIPEA